MPPRPAAPPIIVPARTKHTATVIFSHGLGDTADGWSVLSEQLGPKLPHVKWIFPNAPVQPVTLNMGMSMPSWFDITGLDPGAREDEKGLLESVRTISGFVTEEVDAGLPASRVVVGGFSQGAVIGLLTGLTSERSLGGVVSLSGFLPLHAKMKAMRSDVSKNVQVFWGHGTQDQVVQYSWGVESVRFLREELGMPHVRFESYPMPHSASPKELRDLLGWLEERVPAETPGGKM